MNGFKTIGLMACAIFGATLARPADCQAEVIMTYAQVGTSVDLSASGTINLDGLTIYGSSIRFPVVVANDGVAIVGITSMVTVVDEYTGITGPTKFGGGGEHMASTGTGQPFGVLGYVKRLLVPDGYTSGSSISGTATFDDQTIASLGLTVGTYTYTWGSGATADSLVVEVLAPVVVPEPSSWVLVGAGVGVASLVRRRRRHAGR